MGTYRCEKQQLAVSRQLSAPTNLVVILSEDAFAVANASESKDPYTSTNARFTIH
jgi:hypothetical protein